MSNVGKPCERQLWYMINQPERMRAIPVPNRVKFLYGDILEEMLLYLARVAGHTVEREQEEVGLYGVVGHIDAVIDGVLIDCKSCSPFSFDKFEEGLVADNDDFGYLSQLDQYLHATNIDAGGFLAIDKVSGHICLDRHERTNTDWNAAIDHKRGMLADVSPPPRHFIDEADGASGNRKLGVACSYCPAMKECWPDVRTFLYSRAPRFLTEVRRTPKVPEAKG